MDVIGRATLLFQYASIAMFFAVFMAAMWGIRRRPRRWVMYLPVVVFAAAGLAFYGLAFSGMLSADGFILLGGGASDDRGVADFCIGSRGCVDPGC